MKLFRILLATLVGIIWIAPLATYLGNIFLWITDIRPWVDVPVNKLTVGALWTFFGFFVTCVLWKIILED